MAKRKWGVINAPGTQVIELETPPRITDKELGTAVFIGLTRKGEYGEAVKVTSWGDFVAKCGDVVSWSHLPECVKGFFIESGGTGNAYIVRVGDPANTNNTPAKGTKVLTTAVGNLVVTFTALSEGAWAGAYILEDDVTITAPTGSQVTISATIDDHVFTGGYLEKGTSSYRIISQVGTTCILDHDFSEGAAPYTGWNLVRRNDDGALSFTTSPNRSNSNYFDLEVRYNGQAVLTYEFLTLDPVSPRFIETVINNDANNHYCTVAVTGSTTNYNGLMPVVLDEVITAISGSTVTLTDTYAVVPFTEDEIVGGYLRVVDDNRPYTYKNSYRIKSVALDSGKLKFTVEGTPDVAYVGDVAVIDANIGMSAGYDGALPYNWTTAGYTYIIPLLEYTTTPLKELSKTAGFMKVCIPGYSALDNNDTIASAGIAMAEALNHQFRVEVNTDEDPLTIADANRSDFAVVNFPMWGKIVDSFGGISTIPLIGEILGEECRVANTYSGYFKAEAGIDTVLSRVITCVDSTGNLILTDDNLEDYTPAGINCICEKSGNLVIWGDRTLASTTTWRWKHMREQMSYYEHVLLTSNDWLNFEINSPELWVLFKNYLRDYFFGEYKKGAVYGEDFDDACEIIVDWSNNNDATIDEGLLLAEIWLKFSGTVEKVVIGIGRQYVYEG